LELSLSSDTAVVAAVATDGVANILMAGINGSNSKHVLRSTNDDGGGDEGVQACMAITWLVNIRTMKTSCNLRFNIILEEVSKSQ
jgi:hypothetical protein